MERMIHGLLSPSAIEIKNKSQDQAEDKARDYRKMKGKTVAFDVNVARQVKQAEPLAERPKQSDAHKCYAYYDQDLWHRLSPRHTRSVCFCKFAADINERLVLSIEHCPCS